MQQRTETLLAAYLFLTAGLVLYFSSHLENWGLYFLVHCAGAALILSLRRLPGTVPLPLQFSRDWFPVLTMPLLFKEVEIFARAFGNWGLTESIREWEVFLFKGHPSLYLSSQLPWVPLSEYLHFCYLSFVFLLPAVGGYWYASGRRGAFHELLFLYWLSYSVSLGFFMLFPVDSPFYLSKPLGQPFAGHLFYELVQFVSGRGGARGGAFPSAHVSGAVIVWSVAWQRQRRLALILTPVVAGLVVGTVYGRFHYALDTIAGFALGASIVAGYRMTRSSSDERAARTAKPTSGDRP